MLVVGFEEYNEKMYPHTYDVLGCLLKNYYLKYSGCDDRGVISLQKGTIISNLVRQNPLLSAYQIFSLNKRQCRIKKEISELFTENYDVVVVIDHSALNYVRPHIKNNTKLVFWSHDILTDDHIWVNNSKFIRRLIRKSRDYSGRIDLILAQDHNRAIVLDSVIRTHNIKKFYLPVSLFSNEKTKTTSQLKNNTGSLAGEISLIQIGTIHEHKSSDDILAAFQHMRHNIHLTFLGHISSEMRNLTGSSNRKPAIYDVQPSYAEMRAIISSADIGIIGLKHKNLNNHFYSKACGQLAEFSMLGIPVIIVDSEELGEFVEGQKCGIYARDLSMLEYSIDKIKNGYDFYSKNVSRVYSDYFDLDKYQINMIRTLNQ